MAAILPLSIAAAGLKCQWLRLSKGYPTKHNQTVACQNSEIIINNLGSQIKHLGD
jgi:hypothetical protein